MAATRTRTRTRTPPSLARRRADPGLRSRLPTSQLTPTQRRQRAYNTRVKADNKNPLYDPSQQLSGHNLVSAATQLVNADLGPKEGAVDTQIGNARTQGNALLDRAGAYYRALGGDDAASTAKLQALAAMTNSAVQQNSAQADQALTQASADEQARRTQDAQLRGGGLAGNTDSVAQTIADARQQRAILGPAQANSIAAQGQGWADLANAMAGTRAMRGGEVQGELSNSMQNTIAGLARSKADLESTRGDLLTRNIGDLRQQSFENAITQKGLNIKNADIAATLRGQDVSAATAAANRRQSAADRAASRSVATRGQDLSHQDRVASQQAAARRRRQSAQRQQDAQDARTRAAASKAWSSVENTLPKLGQARFTDPTTGRTRPATTSETIAALRNANTPEWVIQAAVSIRHHGFVTQQVIDLIRRVAPQVRIPNQYRPPNLRSNPGVATYPTKGSSAAGA